MKVLSLLFTIHLQMANSTGLSKNQMSSSHNISTNNAYTYGHTTVGQPSLSMSSRRKPFHFGFKYYFTRAYCHV